MKPTLGKLKVYCNNYLVKIRDGRLCFMCLDENNNIRLFSENCMDFQESCQGAAGIAMMSSYDVNLQNKIRSLDCYDIVATKQCESEIEPIRRVYSNKEPAVWDWCEEDDVQEMTLAEVCKALGKNIKIIKE
jgi:hypothetical protein